MSLNQSSDSHKPHSCPFYLQPPCPLCRGFLYVGISFGL
uniref:Uncharacterized protein n=1 Tax=Rhizophora mucronata TaxID=61149 RepID=A0A2P2KU29_RHIMU